MTPAPASVLIQAGGSAATALSAVLVASQLGLAAQGEFGLLRSWSDVLVMLAVFGLPQGLLHLQYREAVPVAVLRHWIGRYLAGLALAAGAVVALGLGSSLLPALPHRSQALVLVAATPLAAAHLLWRSLTLRSAGVVPYAMVTAAPALLVLVGLLAYVAAGWQSGFAWVLFGAAALSALASDALARRAGTAGPAAMPRGSRRRLWSMSLQTGAQSVLTALSPAALLSASSLLGASLAQVGLVSLGLQLYQMFAVAAVYAAPLVYDRAARSEGRPDAHQLFAALRRRIGVGPMVLAGAAALAGPWAVAQLWPAAAGLAPLLTLMSVAGMLALAVRLLSTLQQARGEFGALSLQAATRLAAGTLLAALLMQAWPATLAVPAAMLAVEAMLLVWLLCLLRAAAPRSEAA